MIGGVYKTAAQAHGGKFHVFSMSKLLSSFPEGHPSRTGVCRGLCLAHAGLRAQGSNVKKAKSGGEEYVNALAMYASKLQEDVSAADVNGDIAGSLRTLFGRQAPLVGLRLVGPVEHFTWRCYGAIAQIAGDTHNRVLVMLPAHVISIQKAGDNVEIFDPNCGALVVKPEKLQSVLSFVLTHPTIERMYRLVTGRDVYVACLR